MYFIQQQGRTWSEIAHFATSSEWLSFGPPIIVDGFRIQGTTSHVTVRTSPELTLTLGPECFDKPTMAKLMTYGRGKRSGQMLLIAQGWGDQEIRGESDVAEFDFLGKLEDRRRGQLAVAREV